MPHNRKTDVAESASPAIAGARGSALGAKRPQQRFTDDYLPYLLAQASAIACAHFAEPIRAAGLNNLAWRMLATLVDDDGLTIGRLSRIVLAQQPRATQVISQLEADRLVIRKHSTKDRRQTLVFITEKGRRRIARLLEAAMDNEKFALRALDRAQLSQLKSLLRDLVNHAWLAELPLAGNEESVERAD